MCLWAHYAADQLERRGLLIVKQTGELLVCGAWEKSYELTDEGVRVARGESLLPRMTGEDGFRKRVHESSKDEWDWITTFFESAVEAEWARHDVRARLWVDEDGNGESYYSLRISRSPEKPLHTSQIRRLFGEPYIKAIDDDDSAG